MLATDAHWISVERTSYGCQWHGAGSQIVFSLHTLFPCILACSPFIPFIFLAEIKHHFFILSNSSNNNIAYCHRCFAVLFSYCIIIMVIIVIIAAAINFTLLSYYRCCFAFKNVIIVITCTLSFSKNYSFMVVSGSCCSWSYQGEGQWIGEHKKSLAYVWV